VFSIITIILAYIDSKIVNFVKLGNDLKNLPKEMKIQWLI
jgi:hypothetical protein